MAQSPRGGLYGPHSLQTPRSGTLACSAVYAKNESPRKRSTTLFHSSVNRRGVVTLDHRPMKKSEGTEQYRDQTGSAHRELGSSRAPLDLRKTEQYSMSWLTSNGSQTLTTSLSHLLCTGSSERHSTTCSRKDGFWPSCIDREPGRFARAQNHHETEHLLGSNRSRPSR